MEAPLSILQVFVRRNICQLRCQHCSLRAGAATHSGIVPLDRAKEIFAEVAAWRAAYSGQIANLFLQWADDGLAGDSDVELYEYEVTLPVTLLPAVSTNGIWLSSLSDGAAQEKIDRLKRAGQSEFQLTFHGLAPTHDAFVGRKGAFDALVRCLQLGKRFGLNAKCHVFVNQQNVGEVEALHHFLHQTEAVESAKISVGVVGYLGWAKRHESLRWDTTGRMRLPASIAAKLPELATETQTAERAMADPDTFRKNILRFINPADRVLVEITAERDVLFGPTCSEATEDPTCVGNLAATSLSDILCAISKRKREAETRLPDLRELATRWADRTSGRLYATDGIDCTFLWLDRMRKSNEQIQTSGASRASV